MFELTAEKCIGCGLCVAACPVAIVSMRDQLPYLARKKESFCLHCQHCALVCPRQALAIAGYVPGKAELAGELDDSAPNIVESVLANRRSMRSYLKKEVDDALINTLCGQAWQAPRGRNGQGLSFSVVRNRAVMDDLRKDLLAKIETLAVAKALDPKHLSYGKFPRAWERSGRDFLFCGAPHILLVSAGPDSVTPMQDAMIALATFEFAAQSHGLGTLWNGIATAAFRDIAPELLPRLGVEDGAELCYGLCFGYPRQRYRYRAIRSSPQLFTVK